MVRGLPRGSSQGSPQREFFGTDTRASELVAGCLLAVWVHHRGLPRSPAWRWVGVAAMAAAVMAWVTVSEEDTWVLQWGLAAFSVVNLGLLVGASVPGPLARALSFGPLVWLGRLSYPLYLIHWPVALAVQRDRLGIAGWPLIVVRFVVSVLLAWGILRLLERPIRTSTRGRLAPGLLLWAAPATTALVLAVWASGWGWAG